MNPNQPTEQDALKPLNPVADVTSRRDWLRRGAVAATPVVASLASAPVYAFNSCTVNPSGFLSASTFASRHPGVNATCVSTGPSYWNGTTSTWPSGVTKATTFASIFTNLGSGMNASTTLGNVLAGSDNFAKYCVAAYLNARAPIVGFPLSTTQVVNEVWKSFNPGPKVAGSLNLNVLTAFTVTEALAWLQVLMPV